MFAHKKDLPAILFNSLHLFLTTFLLLLIPFIMGCSGKEEQAGGQFSMPPMPVEVAPVKLTSMSEKFEAVGTIQAMEEITVVSEIDATVMKLPFEEGGYIRKGSLIAQLDDAQFAAEVVRTEAILHQSKTAYERVQKIAEEKAATLQSLDDAYANMKIAEASYIWAKSRLSKTRILAPFSGMIGSRKVSTGAFIRSGQEITKLANLSELRVSFSAPEQFIANLQKGSEVSISTRIYPDQILNGKIIAIEPILDEGTRNINIVARVQNPSKKLLPGMSANVTASLNERNDAAAIPNEAVFSSGQQSFVYAVNPDSTVSLVEITPGLQLSDVVEIKSGLKEGMIVVRAGHQKLFNGAKVMPVYPKEILSSR